MRWRWFGISLIAVGCTTPNPRSCADGTCGDPALPFCDVNGTLGGLPNECIAPACEPGTFAECRGDTEVRCNATGNDYELSRCERGCEDGVGCRACLPNETACLNGTLMTCDASGAVVETEACPLGCFEDEPRCREVDPSNGLGVYLDMVPSPPDLDLSAGGTIDTTAGTVTASGDVALDIPSFEVPASAGGAPIRVFVANRVVLGDVTVTSGTEYEGPALAIVARDEISVDGIVTVTGGDLRTSGCSGAKGTDVVTPERGNRHASGSGGGAHATDGAAGGAVRPLPGDSTQDIVGGTGGRSEGADDLVPLRGGCAAGGFSSSPVSIAYGARGGGAMQLVSRKAISVSGALDVDGMNGVLIELNDGAAHSGGGGGGGLLLEAPRIDLLGHGGLLARGGDGSGCAPMISACGIPGEGARAGMEARPGRDAIGSSGIRRGAGGGGGLGRIRINTKDGTYTSASSVEVNGALTTGTLATR